MYTFKCNDFLNYNFFIEGPAGNLWKYNFFTLITLATVCANMIQILVHTCRGLGCSIFVEINVKRQSNPSPLEYSALNTARHIFSHAQLFQNIISKSVCLLGTIARVIRVLMCQRTGISRLKVRKKTGDHVFFPKMTRFICAPKKHISSHPSV